MVNYSYSYNIILHPACMHINKGFIAVNLITNNPNSKLDFRGTLLKEVEPALCISLHFKPESQKCLAVVLSQADKVVVLPPQCSSILVFTVKATEG